MYAIMFPAIDPVALSLGPLVIRWYALAYLAGFILGWRYCLSLARLWGGRPNAADLDDFLTWAIVGVIVGGRLGYVLFYNLPGYLDDPIEILRVWHGGMSFHGGLIGVTVSTLLFARRRGISPFRLGDLIAAAGPIGLFFGRIANFVNGELYGRASDMPWAVIFPARRRYSPPSQPTVRSDAGGAADVHHSGGSGATAFYSFPSRHAGGIFFTGYALCRMSAEFFREPDVQLGFLVGNVITMGQILSLPMLLFGLGLIYYARRRGTAA